MDELVLTTSLFIGVVEILRLVSTETTTVIASLVYHEGNPDCRPQLDRIEESMKITRKVPRQRTEVRQRGYYSLVANVSGDYQAIFIYIP